MGEGRADVRPPSTRSPKAKSAFCIGLKGSPDHKAAKQVADFLGTVHHPFTFTIQQGIDALSPDRLRFTDLHDLIKF